MDWRKTHRGYRLVKLSEGFSFGPFELRARSRELFKHGVKLKLRLQPFQILNELLGKPGELVTREQLRDKLWSSETFVDFEQSLNTSVKESSARSSVIRPRSRNISKRFLGLGIASSPQCRP
jgi:DNA-binding response OmpR family regulator